IDRDHLQDFTFLEFYWAYRDYEDVMRLVEKMYRCIIKATTGSLTTTWQGSKISWGKKWPRLDYYELFKGGTGLALASASTDDLKARAASFNLEGAHGTDVGRGRLIDLLFKKTVRPTLMQPGFLINTPVEVEPLAKRMPADPGRVERFQIVACGTEPGKGFSELNDPVDQRGRFEEQMKLRESGDSEAQPLDEDFIEAMEYGMPPMGGFGFSERLFAILMDKPVRETVMFPSLRRKENHT
ncbi:lysine--tRNA ligase, partial [Candidatus Uhrbacteria bacterium]|nr:lysine--tRNA ligase [Candidatus Uhrbacteria bacterium]